MKPFLIPVATLCLCFAGAALMAQDNANANEKSNVKFGKISPEDFNVKEIDTGTAAVVIADMGSSSFEGNSKGWFTLIYKHYKRIKVLNKNGVDAADMKIYLYSDGTDEERLLDLKGYSYNLENGKVTETKLDGNAVFKDKLNKHLVVKKFTMPNVKEGTIIEYSYTISSDFLFNLQPWEFQGAYPRLWSEYNVRIPQFFNYVFLKQGYQPFYIEDGKQGFQSFNVVVSDDPTSRSQTYNINGNVSDLRWVMKDVPGIKAEKFTSTLENHLAKITFQLSEYRFPEQPVKPIMGNWFSMAESMLKRDDFGAALDKSNNWLDDDMKKICGDGTSKLEKAQKIYAFVRDNFTCTDHSAQFMTATPKQTFNKHNGNVADINLLLVTMLHHEGIAADPVILSTRDNGLTNEMYPIMDRFNYVICQAVIDDKPQYLDASRQYLGFARLSSDCYNGHARVVNATLPRAIYFYPDSLLERKATSVFIFNDEKDKGKMKGAFQTSLGYFESVNTREDLKAKGKTDFFKKIKSAYSFDITIDNPEVDSTKTKDDPLTMKYNFSFDKPEDGVLYINPMMAEGIKENYFKAAHRFYPVEMPFAMDETYIFDMEIPEGYVVEELPKPARVNFNDQDGSFEYLIDQNSGHVRLRSRLRINKATFMPEEYDSLREFFGYVVKKHAEQVVLKKK